MLKATNVVPLFKQQTDQNLLNVSITRADLAMVLSLDTGQHLARYPEAALYELCSQIGLMPVPASIDRAVFALRWVGPPLLTAFVSCPPEQAAKFERWQQAVGRRDSAAAAHWLHRLGFWPTHQPN